MMGIFTIVQTEFWSFIPSAHYFLPDMYITSPDSILLQLCIDPILKIKEVWISLYIGALIIIIKPNYEIMKASLGDMIHSKQSIMYP